MAWAPPLSSSSFSFFFLLFVPWWATGLSPSSSTRYLVVGGNGRVGGSTAKHLHILSEVEGRGPAELILGGRSRSSFEASKARILEQLEAISPSSKPASSYASEYASSSSAHPEISFQELDIDGEGGGGDRVVAALAAAMQACGAQCVVHTAGPFQQRTRPALLEAALSLGLRTRPGHFQE